MLRALLLCSVAGRAMAFDPVALVNGGATTALSAVAGVLLLFFLYRYWSDVLVLLTGDPKIHLDVLDGMWWTCCKCCGFCNGEWTRSLTVLPCCPPAIQGANIVRKLGEFLGLLSTTVELRNIVCGDLPYDEDRGDFYLSVEVGTNPAIVTSLAEESRAKVVHWPEVLTLKLKNNPLTPRTRIVVKELNSFGSDELCEVYVSAEQILDWSNDEPDLKDPQTGEPINSLKRLAMTPMSNAMERATPPWICLEFSCETSETRELGNLESFEAYSSNKYATVRGPKYATVKQSKKSKGEAYGGDTMADFKDLYPLLDKDGNPVDEPEEDDLEEIEFWIRRYRRFHRCLSMVVFALILVYGVFRIFVWSCYRQYSWITIAKEKHVHFPISSAHLHDLVKECHDELDGTGIAPGQSPCRPTAEAILEVCTDPGAQKRPTALKSVIFQLTGMEFTHAPTCEAQICYVRELVAPFDVVALGVVIAALVGLVWFKQHGAKAVRKMKREKQQGAKQALEQTKNTRKQNKAAKKNAVPTG